MIYLSEVDGRRVECSFRVEQAEELGVQTRIGPGISRAVDCEGDPCLVRYALCPVCSTGILGQWVTLRDALSCCEGVKKTEISDKELMFHFHNAFLMNSRVAILASPESLAYDFVRRYNIPKQNYLVLKTKEDVRKITDHQVVFVGKEMDIANHVKTPLIKNKFIYEEYRKVKDMTEHNYHVVGTTLYTEWVLEVPTTEQLEKLKIKLDKRKAEDPDFSYKVFVRGARLEYDFPVLIPQT